MLPQLEEIDSNTINYKNDKGILIVSEGFETRSLNYVKLCKKAGKKYKSILLFDNYPVRKSKKKQLWKILQHITSDIREIQFNRYDPASHEKDIVDNIQAIISDSDEVTVDISVMSKILIISIIYFLRNYNDNVRIIYTEPEDYAPSQVEFEKKRENLTTISQLPSVGVYDVVRTPRLSSSVMQDRPSITIGFTSFNERLIRALLSTLSPGRLLLIGSVPPRLKWHAEATQFVHREIIDEYINDNPINTDDSLLTRRASTLDYRQTFQLLKEIYIKYCFTNRIILAPTGSKMQAVACGLIKSCCPDVHIEYPTPESFFVDGYSSEAVHMTHELCLERYSEAVTGIAEYYKLNG